jgi:hypothetical protein
VGVVMRRILLAPARLFHFFILSFESRLDGCLCVNNNLKEVMKDLLIVLIIFPFILKYLPEKSFLIFAIWLGADLLLFSENMDGKDV